ncbi:monocarboxylate transporter 3-like [Thrips palmi]|uniref:Monocarboxylate transporter 3-like n=1 Tax=Thrips palmi TaxID=161013 RepID=A0A6P8YH14_THRPL|nr:monocarboxylate transporter 3-like [Thrips palmi]
MAPAEGGYGWCIVGGYVVNMAAVIQLVQMMGLILKDVFRELDFSESQGATIMTTTQATSMTLGVLAGPLIRRFGFRCVAVAGALLAVSGLALTSTARTFAEFIVYFSFIMGFGLSLSYPSYIVALNVYFKARRTLATAVALSLTGALAILTPQLIRAASWQFGPRAAILVLAGVSLHSLVGAVLLRPLAPAQAQIKSAPAQEMAIKERKDDAEAAAPMLQDTEKSQPGEAKKSTFLDTVSGFFVTLFDLGLVRDPALVLLLLGTSLGLFTDINLVQFLPFMLRDFTTAEASVFMSVFCVTDTACRLVAPALHRLVGRPSRVMYMATLVVFMATRTALLLCRSYEAVMVAMVLIGASRGINVVFLQVLIPDNVPIQKLPAVQGLYLLVCGIVFTSAGPVIGWLLGRTGDYNVILLVLVAMNGLTLVMWTAEYAARTLWGTSSPAAAAP